MIAQARQTLKALPRPLRLRIYVTGIAALTGLLLIAAGIGINLRTAANTGIDTELKGIVEPADVKQPDAGPAEDSAAAADEAPDPEACWPVFGRDNARASDGASLRLGVPGRVKWRRRMGSLIEFPPSMCDGVIYSNTADGLTSAVDAETGEAIWEIKTADPADADTPGVYDTTPAIVGDRLLVAAKDGFLRALDRADGSELWKLDVGSALESSPAIVGDFALLAAQDGRVLKVRVDNGKIAAAYRTAGKINASPAVADGRVVVTNYSGEIVALRLRDLGEIWTTRRSLPGLRSDRMYASAAIVGDTVYVATIGGYVLALNASNGNQKWQHQAGGYFYATPVVSAGKVMLGGFDRQVRALRTTDGSVAWSAPVDGNVSGTGVVVGERFYVSTTAGTTYGFNVASGTLDWQFDNGKYVPGIAGPDGYVFSLNGMLISFAAKPAGE